MTYITARLPKLEDLKKEFENNPDIIETYIKYMGFDGSSESINYLEEKIEEYIKNKNNESTKD